MYNVHLDTRNNRIYWVGSSIEQALIDFIFFLHHLSCFEPRWSQEQNRYMKFYLIISVCVSISEKYVENFRHNQYFCHLKLMPTGLQKLSSLNIFNWSNCFSLSLSFHSIDFWTKFGNGWISTFNFNRKIEIDHLFVYGICQLKIVSFRFSAFKSIEKNHEKKNMQREKKKI